MISSPCLDGTILESDITATGFVTGANTSTSLLTICPTYSRDSASFNGNIATLFIKGLAADSWTTATAICIERTSAFDSQCRAFRARLYARIIRTSALHFVFTHKRDGGITKAGDTCKIRKKLSIIIIQIYVI